MYGDIFSKFKSPTTQQSVIQMVKEMFPLHYMDSDVCSRFKPSTTPYDLSERSHRKERTLLTDKCFIVYLG